MRRLRSGKGTPVLSKAAPPTRAFLTLGKSVAMENREYLLGLAWISADSVTENGDFIF
jgi:hypothetical protein